MTEKKTSPGAEAVRAILDDAGWTHQQTAEALGVTRVTVSRWAAGITKIPDHQLRHLRRASLDARMA